ncbi:ferric-dicitrate binding protein FerR (iron transport regulator) [Pedobacter cryoconitis]|uniref:FecR family protein n=1 Tax=Pedobacter cryoconitis TaxID=188932 RepID=UPI00161DCD29|nr:FecR domain-containing protein [Pedobacter cryoconitis]MBB6270136.1 ferric-dicitrate binding protein FerR (iron transport regulator) [Pedobacter cryoconitis]
MSYQEYTTADFVNDESFTNYVKASDPEAVLFWEKWIQDNPSCQEKANEAKEIIGLLSLGKDPLKKELYESFKNRIDRTISNQRTDYPVIAEKRFSFFKIAAVFTGLAIGAGLLFYIKNKPAEVTLLTFSSPYGQTKTLLLPDSSTVILNANSSVKYPEKWDKQHREVWLTGEAHFKIKHIETENQSPVAFTVHANLTDVNVLGTVFNVDTRTDRTLVALVSGKVALQLQHQSLTLFPGEYAVCKKGETAYRKKTDHLEQLTSWVEGRYIFKDAALSEICDKLSAYYGRAYLIKNKSITAKEISGTLELKNEAVLIQTLAALLNTTVKENGKKVYIGS